MKYEKVMHGGNVGDTISCLAPLSQLNYPIEFYINAKAHHHWRIGREQAESFVKLLEVQPYIKKTGIVDGGYFDLDGWRRNWNHGYNLSDIQ